MFFIRYKNHPPVNLERVFDIKTCPFTDKDTKVTKWVISFFADADGRSSLQWHFRTEEERDHVYQSVIKAFGNDELYTIESFNG